MAVVAFTTVVIQMTPTPAGHSRVHEFIAYALELLQFVNEKICILIKI